jgi:hypothetical protein
MTEVKGTREEGGEIQKSQKAKRKKLEHLPKRSHKEIRVLGEGERKSVITHTILG